jgi:negative regulator of flagellin synthesis FlgM
MKINPVNNNLYYTNNYNKVKNAEEKLPADKIEISQEAKILQKESLKNLEQIRQKINSGFYNSDEVLNKVADEIMKEIK